MCHTAGALGRVKTSLVAELRLPTRRLTCLSLVAAPGIAHDLTLVWSDPDPLVVRALSTG